MESSGGSPAFSQQKMLLDEQRVLKWTLSEAERDIFGISLLQGNIGGREMREEAARLGLNLRGDLFGVIIFSLKNIDRAVFDADTEAPGSVMRQIGFFFRNIVEDLAGEAGFGVLVCRFAGKLPVILCVNEKPGGASQLAKLERRGKRFAADVIRACGENCGLTLSAAVSSFVEGVIGVKLAHDQAREVVDYLTFMSMEREIATYGELSIRFLPDRKEQIAAEIDRDRRFQNAVQMEDYNSALEILHEMMDGEFRPGSFTIQALNNKRYTLLNHFSYAMDSMCASAGPDFIEIFDPMPSVLYNESLRDLKEHIDTVFESYFQQVGDYIAKATPAWLARMVKYIESNYKNADLNTTMIADALGLNAAYSARVFKQHYDIGVLDYIHKVRLREAASLMGQGMKLKEIADRVGYDNPLRMSRAFRRYQGFSPSEMNDAKPVF